jgi:hypothetical protein
MHSATTQTGALLTLWRAANLLLGYNAASMCAGVNAVALQRLSSQLRRDGALVPVFPRPWPRFAQRRCWLQHTAEPAAPLQTHTA